MADMFLGWNNKKCAEWIKTGWDRELIAKTLYGMDQRGQLITRMNSLGKVTAFVGWMYCEDKDKETLLKVKSDGMDNKGKHIVPIFASGKIGIGLMRKYFRLLRDKAMKRGGHLLSFRRKRIYEFGMNHE